MLKCRARCISNNELVYGYPVEVDGVSLLFTGDSNGSALIFYKVEPKTIEPYAFQSDRNGRELYVGDVIRSVYGVAQFTIRWGEHTAYCSLDGAWMNSIGFYAENRGGCFPLGNTAEWAVW